MQHVSTPHTLAYTIASEVMKHINKHFISLQLKSSSFT